MKYTKKILLWPSIFLIVIFAVFYAAKTKKLFFDDSPTATSTTISTNETMRWKTYSNTKYGFKFSYPPEVTLGDFDEQTGQSELFVFTIDSLSIPKDFNVGIYPADINENIASYRKLRGQTFTPISFNNNVWYRTTVVSKIEYTQFFIEKGGYVFRIEVYDPSKEDTLKKILESFSFTD